jgi:GT2 family glycosyltransferase
MDISILIVNFNTKKLLEQTIQSVTNTVKNINYEIIVVDNASSDGSVEVIKKNYRNVILIKNKTNDGFAKANNIGIKKAKGRYILLLNSDTLLVNDCIEKSIKYLDNNKDVGALGCKVVLPNGKLDTACKRGYPTPEASFFYMLKLDKLFPSVKRFGQYNLSYLSQNEINEVDSLVGAFMMVRKDTIDEVGLLDEKFFMYGEDIDWCMRIKEAGWKIIYYPEASIIHYKGASSKKKRHKILFEFHRAMYIFYKKHYLKKYNIIVTLLVYIGIGLKLGVSLLINLFKRRR